MVIDGMLKDGLWDVYNDYAMGMCGELCADQHMITREEQVPAYKLQLYLASIFFPGNIFQIHQFYFFSVIKSIIF